MPSPIITHPINKWYYPLLYTEPELSVMKTEPAGRVGVPEGWLQRLAYPQSPQPPSAHTSTVHLAQLSRLPAFCRDYIQPHKQSAGPTQHQICGLGPHEIIQSPSSGQRPPWTKDTRYLQDPLWVR
jgi:hypothetical protein